ncbi:MAG TPA: methyltransferase domain-containing protein [Polyangiaceae bacterium]|nr:methyltransferase domain-containing protein [Polyangiaceae bacterium]
MPRPPLLERLSDPGFTPGRRDVAPLCALLVGEDQANAKRAEAALVRAGAAATVGVIAFAEGAPRPEAYRVARLLGALGGEPARAYLARRLREATGKERRWAATSLAKVSPTDAEGPLLDALDALGKAGEAGDVARGEDVRAFVQALGKVGGRATLRALDRVTTPDPETARVVEKARLLVTRTASRGETRGAVGPAFDLEAPRDARGRVSLRFTCREGLESVLAEELGACGPRTQVMYTGRGFVSVVHTGPLREVLAARTALSLAFELDAYSPPTEAPDGGLPARVAAFLTSPAVLEVVATEGHGRGGKARFRLVLTSEGYGRAAVFEVARRVAASGAPLLNDPTESDWSFTVSERGDRLAALLEPKNVQSARFSYRTRDVPAASHPTVAAAIARLSAPRPDDVVWDPFCGSGLELIERARLGPARALVGTDVDPRAIDAALENARGAGVTVDVRQGDAREVPCPAGLTTVLTNPPLGRRVLPGEHEALLVDMLRRVGAALAPGGRLVWISPSRRLDAVADAAGLALQRAFDVDLGGFRGRLEIRVKPGAAPPAAYKGRRRGPR